MNTICKLLNISVPIIQGGMGNISNAQLAAAVSEAGGLGTIGCGTMQPDEVEEIIQSAKQLTDKPLAINIAINVTPYVEQLIELTIKHRISVVSLSAGNPAPFIPKLHEHGIKVIVLVAAVKHAKKAEQAGADILVAEGYEAAGINSDLELTTFTLVPQIVQHVTIPVVAAGGIGDGKGFAAALALGAKGVQLGTRLIATKEAPFHETYKKRLLDAEDTETMIVGKTVGRLRRILKSSYGKKLLELEKEGMTLQEYGELTSEKQHIQGALKGDMEKGFLNSGQVAGLITHIPSVKTLFDDMLTDARAQVNEMGQQLGTLEEKTK